jgi:hypothetical protein
VAVSETATKKSRARLEEIPASFFLCVRQLKDFGTLFYEFANQGHFVFGAEASGRGPQAHHFYFD